MNAAGGLNAAGDPALLALEQTANAHLREGDESAAERVSREILARAPDHPGALATLGLALHFMQRFGEAEAVFERLATLQPQEIAHWVNLGTARRAGGRPDEALPAYARAAALGEASADFLYNVGLTHLARSDFLAAQAVFGQALAKSPGDAELHVALARASYEALDTNAALTALAGWSGFEGLETQVLADIAFLSMNLGDEKGATAALERALADPEPAPAAALTLVKVLERTNRVREATALLARVRALPGAAEETRDIRAAEAQLAQRAGEHEKAALLFRQEIADAGAFENRHYALFPLAKSLDALGRSAEAFDALREAHASQQAHVLATAPAVALRGAPTMEITRYGCDPADVAAWRDADAPDIADSPVFIVAFPRSGTTLLELTLDAHPDLVSMDEQPFLQNALDDMVGLGIDYPAALAAATPAQLQYLRAGYWERVDTKVKLAPGQRLVDKNPLNLLRLPVIRRLFPASPIVLAVRHPCDVLLSCYMQHFRAPDFALLCRDLPTLAHGFRRAFDFWYEQSAILAPRVLEVRYESFVTQFEPGVRALADFLALPWRDAMLEPGAHAQRKGFISTPSYSQVVQPVNARSVGRWSRYAAQFAPVLPVLEPLLARWGYPTAPGAGGTGAAPGAPGLPNSR
jgi:tetratricopeptide (TPR) repeat protein